MKEESRIVELLAEVVYRQDVMIDEVKNVKDEIVNLKGEIVNLKGENQITNLSIKELRLSVMKLADEIVLVHDHERRISTLERIVSK